jgi:hypothetical protein
VVLGSHPGQSHEAILPALRMRNAPHLGTDCRIPEAVQVLWL